MTNKPYYRALLLLNERLVAWCVPLLLAACGVSVPAVAPSPASDAAPPTSASAKGWWRASYEIAWPEDQPPSWYMDVLLAHRVIEPALKDFRPAIELWRFHRRAMRDGAGHRFTFLFYSSAGTAKNIYTELRASPAAQRLLSAHRLVRIDYDDPRRNLKPKIEDASDPSWPLPVQKTWPRYIMGASEMWLGLIDEMAEQSGKAPDDEDFYRGLQAELGKLWREQGQHPFLHHLNALFGYEEMIVINRKGEAIVF